MARKKEKIYLDYAATTPLDEKVLKAMLAYLKENFGNPSSPHSFGQKAKIAVEEARKKVADFLNCLPGEVYFTSGATEANNLAILGASRAAQKKGLKPHIITSKIEHHSVLEPCRQAEKQGVEITYLPVDKEGLVRVADVEKAIKKNTILVSIGYANNEIGAIQPIGQIGHLIGQKMSYPLFHVDAVQAVNYLSCDVKKLGVDLLTLSGHKIYGPKGVGALYTKQGAPIEPLIYGGGQETGMRSGTENVAAIVGLGTAVVGVRLQQTKSGRVKKLRNKLIDGILERIPGSRLNGPRKNRLPNNVNVFLPGKEGEALVLALDQEGIAVSTGSACATKSLKPSHVLLALGLSKKEALSSLRISLGKYTTEEEINKTLKALTKIFRQVNI